MQTNLVTHTAVAGMLSLLAFGTAAADDRTDMGGKYIATVVKQDVFRLADKPGHLLIVGSSRGTNESTGALAWMAGSRVTETWAADIVNGSGTIEGYSTFARGRDNESSHWFGKTTTIVRRGKIPVTTSTGTWETVSGSGAWAGASGSGTWKETAISPTQSASQWSGHRSAIRDAALGHLRSEIVRVFLCDCTRHPHSTPDSMRQ